MSTSDLFTVLKLEQDQDGYLCISTYKGPYTSLDRAKMELRMTARTFSQMWPQTCKDPFEDYFNKDCTSWGDLPGDPRRTRFVAIKISPNAPVKVIS